MAVRVLEQTGINKNFDQVFVLDGSEYLFKWRTNTRDNDALYLTIETSAGDVLGSSIKIVPNFFLNYRFRSNSAPPGLLFAYSPDDSLAAVKASDLETEVQILYYDLAELEAQGLI